MSEVVHVHRCRDWWDPIGSRQTELEPWRVGLVVGDLVTGEWTEDQAAIRNGRGVGPDEPLEPGDHVTLVLQPMAGGVLTLASAALTFATIGGYSLYKSLTLKPPTARENRDSQTYDWGGVQTAYNAKGLKVPLVYGAMRLGGFVAQRSIVVVDGGSEPRSILYLLIQLGLGPFEEIAGYTTDQDGLLPEDLAQVFINGNPANNYSGLRAWIRMGTPSQSVIPGFNQIERLTRVDLPVAQAATPVLDYSTATTFTTTNQLEAARIGLTFPRGLYSVDGNGNLLSRTQSFDVRYRTVDALGNATSSYREDPGNPHEITLDLQAPARFQIPVTFEDPGGATGGTVGQGMEPDPGSHVAAFNNAISRPGGIWAANSEPQELTFGGWFYADPTDSAFAGWFGGLIQANRSNISNQDLQLAAGDPVYGFAIKLRGLSPNQTSVVGYVGDGTDDFPNGAVGLGVNQFGGLPGQLVDRGLWHHVAITFKREGLGAGISRHRLYVDGFLVEEEGSSIGMKFPTTSDYRLRIGQIDPYSGTVVGAGIANGYLFDDCFLVEREITQAEVSELWNGGNGRGVAITLPGLCGLWKFEDDLVDSTIYGNDLVSVGDINYKAGKIAEGASPVGAPLLSAYEIQVQAREAPIDQPTAQNECRWEDLVEITFDEIAYRNRALIAFEIDATDQLAGNQPNILTDCKARRGLRYDSSSGFWVEEFSQNPAWVAAAFATDSKDGLGRFFTSEDLDTETFEALGARADEWVRDRRATFGIKSFGPTTFGGENAVELKFTGKPPAHWTTGVPLIRFGTPVAPGISTGQATINSTFAGSEAWPLAAPITLDGNNDWVGYLVRLESIADGTWSLFESEGEYDVAGAGGEILFEGRERRFQCDIALDGRGGNAWEFLIQILQTAGAYPIKVGRRLRLKFSADRAPVQLFNADSIIANSFKMRRTSPDLRFNRAIGEILDREKGFARQPVQIDHPDVKAPTGEVSVVSQTTELRGVTRRTQAKRDLARVLNESKLRRTILEWRSHFPALAAEVGDLVLVEHPMPVYGFGGLTAGASSTVREVYVDKPFTLQGGASYKVAVVNRLTGRLYTANVSSAAGDYVAGARIALSSDLIDASANTHVPGSGDLWAIGRLESVVKEVELQSIRTDTQTLERVLTALEWDANVESEDDFPDPQEDSGSELIAPPDPMSAPQLLALYATDASHISDGSGRIEPAILVSWRLTRQSYYTAKTVEVYLEPDGGSSATPRLVATAPASTGRVLVRGSELRTFATYKVRARAVSDTGQAEPLAIARQSRVLLGAQVPQPAPPTGLTLTVQGDQVTYELEGARSSSQVELRRGVGWFLADRIGLVPGDTDSLGPTTDWVWVPTNAAGRGVPSIIARYRFGRGLVSEAVTLTPTLSARLGVGASVVAVSIEDEGWSTAEAALDDMVATTFAGDSVLELAPSMTAGAGTATYTTRFFDCGRERNHHLSVVAEARQINPTPIGEWPPMARNRRGTNWDLLEGPLDPADPFYGRVEKVVEIRTSDTDDPSGGSWEVYRPGVYRCRSFQMRFSFTRPAAVSGNEWNVRVYRIGVQANPAREVDPPSVIDGGTF